MAGQGKTTFIAGDILTASQVNGYLMDQSVMVFAGTAARGSALPSPSEGMISYLADSNAIQFNDGSTWKPAANAGEIIQVKQTAKHDVFTTTSVSFVDVTGLSVSITPNASSNKVLVMVTHGANQKDSSNTSMGMRLFRGATQIAQIMIDGGKDGASGRQDFGGTSINVLDEPATTSATTYKTQANSQNNSSSTSVQSGGGVSTMILMEVTP
jgi:hypothetical protein